MTMSTDDPKPERQGDVELARVQRVLSDRSTWATPPQSGAEDLLANIRAEREGSRHKRTTWLGRFWPRVAFGLAAVVLVGRVAAVLLAPEGITDQILLSGTELEPTATGTAALIATGSGWSIRLDLSDLPPAGPGYYYEGWVWNEAGEGVSIGTFHLRGGPEPIQLWAGVDVDAYPWIWITLQEEGAGPVVSDEIVMRGMRESTD